MTEKAELDVKLRKLVEFLGSSTFKALDAEEQKRLARQSEIMMDYSLILAERIAAFS